MSDNPHEAAIQEMSANPAIKRALKIVASYARHFGYVAVVIDNDGYSGFFKVDALHQAENEIASIRRREQIRLASEVIRNIKVDLDITRIKRWANDDEE